MENKKPCKCSGSSIRTMLIESETLFKCPRCGGWVERPKLAKAIAAQKASKPTPERVARQMEASIAVRKRLDNR